MTTSRDVLHDMQLLRDLATANARTQAELGPLPPGGVPVTPKRKPKPMHVHAPAPTSTHQDSKDEAMKLSHATVVAALGVTGTLAACGAGGALQESNVTSPQQEEQPRSTSAAVASAVQKQSSKAPSEASPSDSKDSSGDDLKIFLPERSTILSSATGDLDRDGHMDAVVVVDPARTGREFLGEGPSRIVMLLIRDENGRLRKTKQSNTLVPCEKCGGMAGDPFGYVQVKNGAFTTVIEGGSPSARWSEVYEFDYKSDLDGWFLRKIERSVSDRIDNRNEKETLTTADFGEVRFEDFDRSSLPDFILQ